MRLKAKTPGFSIPTISWLRDGDEIKVRKGVLISQDASGVATLVVEKCLLVSTRPRVSTMSANVRPLALTVTVTLWLRRLSGLDISLSASTSSAQLEIKEGVLKKEDGEGRVGEGQEGEGRDREDGEGAWVPLLTQ